MVISFNSHNTISAIMTYFTCHNALRLFKNSHNMKFRVVTVSLMPQRVVGFFSAHWAFSIFELNIYKSKWVYSLYTEVLFLFAMKQTVVRTCVRLVARLELQPIRCAMTGVLCCVVCVVLKTKCNCMIKVCVNALRSRLRGVLPTAREAHGYNCLLNHTNQR